ncbi:hypothetical protein [Thalassovita taeanensis]|uniref:Uncharacterized protein n=1 Tax=Thalassovita taeanensis TaxID=657014 RepID=A0A1H9FAG4_9RHOB|nr:hypothetical protein [Thalassovita taeanensis]SEQ34934.1 hypothetical protein SAMN04488092_10611 [Thalassovita taeanensis]
MSNTRKEDALRHIERNLLRESPGLTDGALAYLLAEAADLIEVRSYEAGSTMDVKEAVASLKSTEIGKMVFREAEPADDVAAQRARLADLPPAQRMAAARKLGIG